LHIIDVKIYLLPQSDCATAVWDSFGQMYLEDDIFADIIGLSLTTVR